MQAATACEDINNFILVSPINEKTKQKYLEKVADRAYTPLEIERISTISAGFTSSSHMAHPEPKNGSASIVRSHLMGVLHVFERIFFAFWARALPVAKPIYRMT